MTRSSFYTTTSEPRWWAGIYGRIIAVIVLVVLLGVAIFGFRVAFSDTKGRGDVIRQRNSADNRVLQQQKFQDLYADYTASVQKVPLYQAAAEGGDATARTNLIGLQSHCLDVVNQYNQDSAKVLAGDFKDTDLPVTLDPIDCQGKSTP